MINTRLVMSAAAIFLGLAGAACLFFPDEVLKLYLVDSMGFTASVDVCRAPVLIQILGGCLFPLALLDWYSKHNVMGGIYGRPVVGTNFGHFVIGSLVLVKAAINQSGNVAILVTLVVYVLFAIAFSLMMFGKPKLPQEN